MSHRASTRERIQRDAPAFSDVISSAFRNLSFRKLRNRRVCRQRRWTDIPLSPRTYIRADTNAKGHLGPVCDTDACGRPTTGNNSVKMQVSRRFQFRLRTLLIGVTLLAAVSGYVGRQREHDRKREAALQLVLNLGGMYSEPPSPIRIELPPESTLADCRQIAAAVPDAEIWIWRVPIVLMGSVRRRMSCDLKTSRLQ